MFSRDPYKKLHRRRRRGSQPLAFSTLAFVLVGCAAAAAAWISPPENLRPPGIALSTHAATPAAETPGAEIAVLTARDAIGAAAVLALPAAVPKDWSDGLELTIDGDIKRNQSISVALGKRGISQAAIQSLVTGMRGKFDFRSCRPGDTWQAEVGADGTIRRFRYQSSPTDVWEAHRDGNGYRTTKADVPVERRQEAVTGAIESSLWQSFERTPAGGQLAAQYTGVFAYTIDFATETQNGDRFGAVYETTWLDGQQLSTGKLLAAKYSGEAGEHWAFYWNGAYYTEKAESVERQFLRSPLATERITSRYGRRFHPVLGKMKMHAGVDYGAPTGTPVQAVADGKVVWAGWKGANGNLVAIQHAGGYTTYYAHLSKIGKGIRPGVRVRKKQLIGKVGSTGRSTGPHLHFGMKRHGKFINPLEVDFERGTPLTGKEKQRFLTEIASLKSKLQ